MSKSGENEESPEAFPDSPKYSVEYSPKKGKPGWAVFRVAGPTGKAKKVGTWSSPTSARNIAEALNEYRGREM